MKKQLLAGATILALAAGMTSNALAFDQGTGNSRYVRGSHARGYGEIRSMRARHDSRFDGVRGYESWRHGGWGASEAAYARDAGPGYYSLGPLGFTSAPPGSYSGYGAPISAWSR